MEGEYFRPRFHCMAALDTGDSGEDGVSFPVAQSLANMLGVMHATLHGY